MEVVNLSRKNERRSHTAPIYAFAMTWLIMSAVVPLYKLWALLVTVGLSCAVAALVNAREEKRARAEDAEEGSSAAPKAKEKAAETPAPAKSYGPEIDGIIADGNKALAEMGRIYASVKDPEVRSKINEIMRITDKIVQDAIADPNDVPQIKKFMNYYLPTTIKLLNTYDRMSDQGIEGDNLDKSMKNINEMLDTAIVAYKKRLDSLFANQALDIETDIDVMNTMLAREGLSGEKDFEVKSSAK